MKKQVEGGRKNRSLGHPLWELHGAVLDLRLMTRGKICQPIFNVVAPRILSIST